MTAECEGGDGGFFGGFFGDEVGGGVCGGGFEIYCKTQGGWIALNDMNA